MTQTNSCEGQDPPSPGFVGNVSIVTCEAEGGGALVTAADVGREGSGRGAGIGYLPFHNQTEGLVGAFHQADCLLSVATQGNLVDVDKLVSHLETHSCCLAAFLHLEHKHSRWRTEN